MSGTTMDNKPLLPVPPDPNSTPMTEDRKADLPAAQAPLKIQSSELEPSAFPAEQRQTAPVQAFSLRRVFVGPDGIFVLPRWLLYLVLAWIIFQMEGWLVVSVQSRLNRPWSQLAIEAMLMVAVILPGFVMARIERRPFGDFGLPVRRAFGRNFWIGTAWGIASLSVLMLVLRATGTFEFGSVALHGLRLWKFGGYYAVLFLFTGFFEDFLMRGYSQWVLTRGINFWPAAVFLSIAFGYIHGSNPGEADRGLVAAGMIGFFLCLTLRRTGDLWWAVGFHMAWDWGESYLYSVPDSGALLPGHLLNSNRHGPDWLTGGSVGPEGSYLIFVLIPMLWFVFDRVYPEAKYRG